MVINKPKMESTWSIPDYAILVRLSQRDQEAYKIVYHRFKGVLFMHARRMLKDDEAARDAVQEVYTTLWEKAESINPRGNIAGWLYTCLRNQILKSIQTDQKQEHYLASLASFEENPDAMQADTNLRLKELSAIFERELAKLPPRMRNIYELSRKGYLSHKEIAAQLSIKEGTVKQQINNALHILRSKLSMLFFLQLSKSILALAYWLYK